MKVSLNTPDGRLLARLINVAHRFGCSYTGVHAQRDANDTYAATIEFNGPAESLRRLDLHVSKLITDDKEYSQ